MNICAKCGHNRPGARFCDSCGAELALAVEEHHKVVTVMFCDASAPARWVRGQTRRFCRSRATSSG